MRISSTTSTRRRPRCCSAAAASGNTAFRRCMTFHSLSKRSSLPGLRSGFVAGDAALIKPFLLYRTYHGCAMPIPTQQASIAAWSDDAHVAANRALYRRKFDRVLPILQPVIDVVAPGRRLLPVARRGRRRRGLHRRPVRRAEHHRRARVIPGARHAQRQSRRGLRTHLARCTRRGMRAGCRTHPRISSCHGNTPDHDRLPAPAHRGRVRETRRTHALHHRPSAAAGAGRRHRPARLGPGPRGREARRYAGRSTSG